MSLILKPQPLQLRQQFLLSALVAVVIRQFFADCSGRGIVVKWPNDIYFQDRKAGGILIENIITGVEWRWAIIGIGLNINQTEFNPDLPNPVSLKQISGKDFQCVELAKELGEMVCEKFSGCRLPDTGGMDSGYQLPVTSGLSFTSNLLNEYNSHLYKRQQIVKLKKDNRVFEAIIKEVSPTGQLIVEHVMEERFDFGEVVWVV